MSTKTLFLIASLSIAAAASAQAPAQPAAVSAASASAPVAGPRTFYYWLHPKLGMVKVDRATNAMLTGTRSRADREG